MKGKKPWPESFVLSVHTAKRKMSITLTYITRSIDDMSTVPVRAACKLSYMSWHIYLVSLM